jgi:small subunit ribosomal protein S1
MNVSGGIARVELGEGVQGSCRMDAADNSAKETDKAAFSGNKPADLGSLSSMLQQRWKSGASPTSAKPDASSAGQIRSFRISKLDPAAKKIELELAKGLRVNEE